MYTRKPLPKTQYELSKGVDDKQFDRQNDVRRDDDSLQELSIGLYDIDYAIKYYFEEVIRPEIEEFGTIVKVPVMYGSPEKWKNVQADGYFRDKNGKIQSPLIAYKRTSIAKNRSLSSKVDANFPQLYYTQEVKYTQVNKYDQFSTLTNSKPIKTYINTVIPDYIDVTYDVVIWTDYVESMNKLVESMIYTEGAYWGDMEKFKFRSKIDNFTNTTDLLQDADRIVRTSFQLTIFGQIVPDVLAKSLSKKQSEKSFSPRQIVLETTPDANPEVFQQKDVTAIGGSVNFTNPTVTSTINPASLNDANLVAYLLANKTIEATSVVTPGEAYFNGSFLTAPSGLPATSVTNFAFFVNGQFVEPSAIIGFVDNGGGLCTLSLDPAYLGFTLATQDEVVAIGKFA
jgi:hypothetical protein